MTPVEAETVPVTPTSPAPSRRNWLPLLALVIGLVLGGAIGLLWPTLSRPGTDSAEAGFARDMSTHHAQAVEMGMIAYARGATGDVRFMGRDIALTQQGQIGIMQSWLREWDLSPTGSKPPMAWMPDGAASVRNGLMPGMASPEEMTALRNATGKGLDVQFLRLMQKHHLGGIHMAEAVLKATDEPEVREFAKLMKDGQQRELTDIQTALNQVTATP